MNNNKIPHSRDLSIGFVLYKLTICASIKMKNKNKHTTLSEQFQNLIEK
jgi:hypothetical protein